MTQAREGRIIVGTSGWHYKHWKNVFYPGEIPDSKFLKYYSSKFGTVEINNSFYKLSNDRRWKCNRSGDYDATLSAWWVSKSINR